MESNSRFVPNFGDGLLSPFLGTSRISKNPVPLSPILGTGCPQFWGRGSVFWRPERSAIPPQEIPSCRRGLVGQFGQPPGRRSTVRTHAKAAGGCEDDEAVVLQLPKPARNPAGVRVDLLRRDPLRQIDFAVVINLRIVPTPQRDVERS